MRLFLKSTKSAYPTEIKKGIGQDKANKNFRILKQYGKLVLTCLMIDTGDSIFPLNRKITAP